MQRTRLTCEKDPELQAPVYGFDKCETSVNFNSCLFLKELTYRVANINH